MRERGFWSWYVNAARVDFLGNLIGLVFDWRPYALGFLGWLVSFLGLPAISQWSPATIWVASFICGACAAIIAAAVLLFIRVIKGTDAPTARASMAGAKFSRQIPDIRVADYPRLVALFEGREADKLLPLLEAGELIAWGRPMRTVGETPLTKIASDLWKNHFCLYLPAGGLGQRNQTYLKTKARQETSYYDVFLNSAQIEAAWPTIIIKTLDDLVAEGTVENNRLIPPIADYNDADERARFAAWQTRVLELLKDRPKAYSKIRTLHRFNGIFHKANGKTAAQEQMEAIWTETITRLRAIIETL